MMWIDYAIITIFFFAGLFGIFNGPVLQFMRIGGLLISFFLAFFYYNALSNFLQGVFPPTITNLMSYFIIFGFMSIFTLLLTDVAKDFMDKWEIGKWNKWMGVLGAMFGVLYGVVFSGSIIFGIFLICGKSTCDYVYTSVVAPPIGKGMENITSILPESFSNKVIVFTEEAKNQEIRNTTKVAKNVIPY